MALVLVICIQVMDFCQTALYLAQIYNLSKEGDSKLTPKIEQLPQR